MTDTLQRQIGGLHYKGTAYQPVHMWFRNRLDGFIGSAVKYVTRWRKKGGKADLQKAIHLIELREELLRGPRDRIDPVQYAMANQLSASETLAVVALDRYQRGEAPASEAIALIQRVIDTE